MNVSRPALTRGAIWSVGCYAVSVILRFGTNVILAHLLDPELFGIMVIIQSLRTGIELVTDAGIPQNVVFNKDGEKPEFYNTAWTIQLIRGVVLSLLCLALAGPVASLYNIPVLAIQITALTMAINGVASVSVLLAERRMHVKLRSLFDTAVDLVSSLCLITLAYNYPSLWALVIGGVISTAIRAGATYFLPESRQSFALSPRYVSEIFNFGKWIFAASIVNFAAMNFDRLYLGTVAPLAILGVFGLARSIAELPSTLAVRLNTFLTFPIISTATAVSRTSLREDLVPIRLKFLLAAAVCISGGASIADLLIKLIYDNRYHEAAWMLPVLLTGVWGTVLCSTNETVLLGLGKPIYGALANLAKFIYLLIGLPVAYNLLGIFGAVLVVASSDLLRYVPVVIGQMREQFAFRAQDFSMTLAMLVLICLWTGLRWLAGFGTAFDQLPIFVPA